MKIVYLTNGMSPKDGWGRYSSDLVCGVKESGHEVFVLKEKDDGSEGISVLKRGLGVFSSAWKIRKYLKDADIIHALDGYPYAIIAALANLGLNKKLIITGVGTYAVDPLYNYKIAWLLKWAYRRADKVAAISHYAQNEILKKIVPREIEVVCPGIRYKSFHKSREESEENYLLSVGALKRRKGYHISIPAFASARKKIGNLKYIIVGDQNDQKYFNHLKKLAVDHQVEKEVVFLRNLSDEELSRLYGRAKVFIMPSINEKNNFEGYGLVFLEAAAAGLPVIGTINNGIADAVKDGLNGILVEQNNVEAAAGAIVNILEDHNRWREMSAYGYQWAREHDWLESAEKYTAIYESVLIKR